MTKRVDMNEIDAADVINHAKPSHRARELKPYDPSVYGSSQEPEPTIPPIEEPNPIREKETMPEEPKRRRGKVQSEPQDYKSLFLHEVAITARSGKTVYICQRHHEKVADILHTIGKREVSLFSYIYNVLEHHFNTFDDELNELYDINLKKRI